MMDYLVINGALSFALQTMLLVRGVQIGLFRRYVPFYSYLTYVVFIDLFRWLAFFSWGYGTKAYHYAYNIPNLFFPPLQLWILWDLYAKFGSSKKSRFGALWLIIVSTMVSLPIAFNLALGRGTFFDKFHALLLPFQAAFCLIVCICLSKNRSVILGRNDKGIILGLSILLSLQSVNYAYRVFDFGNRFISLFFVQFVYMTTLLVLAWYLWDYHPSRFRDTAVAERVARLEAGFQGLVRGLLFRK